MLRLFRGFRQRGEGFHAKAQRVSSKGAKNIVHYDD